MHKIQHEPVGSPMPTVSIIIPCYNQAEFLQQAVDSALAQTWAPDSEVIVVNDGSTDNSLEIARSYGNSIRVVNQSNKGLPGARNAGIMNSCGEFVLPLDADDWIEPVYLERTLPLMAEGVAIVSTDYTYFGMENRYIPTPLTTLEMEKHCNHIPVCSLIRKQALLETGGYNPKLSAYEDWCLWIDILKRGWQHRVLNQPLFHYRRRAAGMYETEVNTPGRHDHLVAQIRELHRELYA